MTCLSQNRFHDRRLSDDAPVTCLSQNRVSDYYFNGRHLPDNAPVTRLSSKVGAPLEAFSSPLLLGRLVASAVVLWPRPAPVPQCSDQGDLFMFIEGGSRRAPGSVGMASPKGCGQSDMLLALLDEFQLKEKSDALKGLGVLTVGDLYWVDEDDLGEIGIKLVPRRKLLKAAGGSVTDDVDVRSGQLVKAAREARSAAADALAAALLSGEDVRDSVARCIEMARASFDHVDCTPELAAKALVAISRAQASCRQSELHYSAIRQAEQAVRAFLIWRTQLRSPLGDMGAFITELTAAFGAVRIDDKLYKALMRSHSELVRSRFAGAFLSNAGRARRRRGRR